MGRDIRRNTIQKKLARKSKKPPHPHRSRRARSAERNRAKDDRGFRQMLERRQLHDSPQYQWQQPCRQRRRTGVRHEIHLRDPQRAPGRPARILHPRIGTAARHASFSPADKGLAGEPTCTLSRPGQRRRGPRNNDLCRRKALSRCVLFPRCAKTKAAAEFHRRNLRGPDHLECNRPLSRRRYGTRI